MRKSKCRALALSVVLLCPLLATGCGSADEILFPENPRPFLYLVLNQTTAPVGRPVQTAFLLTVVRADSAAYRSAERFEMRRVSGGKVFDWRNESLFGEIAFTGTEPQLAEGNYLLPDTATDRGLGFQDLQPGATYELVIETKDEVIRGRTTIPDTFSISVIERDGRPVAVWPSVAGAAGYSVSASGDEIFRPSIQTDTTFHLAPAPGPVTVRAMDPHAFRYLTDEDARRAGIEGGLGVFGAIQTVRRP